MAKKPAKTKAGPGMAWPDIDETRRSNEPAEPLPPGPAHQRWIDNDVGVFKRKGFVAKPSAPLLGPEEKARIAREKVDAAQAELERVQAENERDKPVTLASLTTAIRQGVKAPVETVPMPVRLEVEQVRMLKLLASYEQTTASAIIRASIKERLEQARQGNPGFDAAVRSSMNK
jgi:hypothetical protein